MFLVDAKKQVPSRRYHIISQERGLNRSAAIDSLLFH